MIKIRDSNKEEPRLLASSPMLNYYKYFRYFKELG